MGQCGSSAPGLAKRIGAASFVAGLVISVSAPARTCSISTCGVPRQNSPDRGTLVSPMTRAPPALGPGRFDLLADLSHPHWFDL